MINLSLNHGKNIFLSASSASRANEVSGREENSKALSLAEPTESAEKFIKSPVSRIMRPPNSVHTLRPYQGRSNSYAKGT